MGMFNSFDTDEERSSARVVFSTTNVNSILIINDNKKLPYDTKNEIRYTITDEHNYT